MRTLGSRVLAVLLLLAAVTVGEVTSGLPGDGEVWWTSVDCPPGVQLPCLDSSVSLADLPAWAR